MKTAVLPYFVSYQFSESGLLHPETIWLAGDPNSQRPWDGAVATPVSTLLGPLVPFDKEYHVLANPEPTKAPLISP